MNNEHSFTCSGQPHTYMCIYIFRGAGAGGLMRLKKKAGARLGRVDGGVCQAWQYFGEDLKLRMQWSDLHEKNSPWLQEEAFVTGELAWRRTPVGAGLEPLECVTVMRDLLLATAGWAVDYVRPVDWMGNGEKYIFLTSVWDIKIVYSLGQKSHMLKTNSRVE